MADDTDNSNKRKHETLSLAKKVEILRKLDRGQKKVQLAREYNVGRATIYDIKKKRAQIEKFVNNIGVGASSRFTLRRCDYVLMEDVLYAWFLEERRHNNTLSEKAIKKKSLHFYKEIYKNDDFKASDGWFHNFKLRYGINGLYEPVIKTKVTKYKAPLSKPDNDENLANFSKVLVKSEQSEVPTGHIVIKQEPQDDTSDAQQLTEDINWADIKTDTEAVEQEGRVSLDKTDANSVNYTNWDDDSAVFVSHLKSRMDKLNHEQRFIAQKLLSDVMMLAETNQLQLTSAVVNRIQKQERNNPCKGNDPLIIEYS